jgi:hypothetical protein
LDSSTSLYSSKATQNHGVTLNGKAEEITSYTMREDPLSNNNKIMKHNEEIIAGGK